MEGVRSRIFGTDWTLAKREAVSLDYFQAQLSLSSSLEKTVYSDDCPAHAACLRRAPITTSPLFCERSFSSLMFEFCLIFVFASVDPKQPVDWRLSGDLSHRSRVFF